MSGNRKSNGNGRSQRFDTAEDAAASVVHIPQDLQSEAAALGSVILEPETLGVLSTFVTSPEAFFKEENAIIFRVMLDMVSGGMALDALTLHRELANRALLERVGGIEYVKELANAVPTSRHVATYAAFVKEKWMKRQAISVLVKALRGVYEDPKDRKPVAAQICVDAAIADLMEMGASGQCRIAKSMKSIVREVKAELESSDMSMGLQTGFKELDELTGGLHKGEMIIIAARPSVGKTALLINFIEHGLYGDDNYLLFSMEQRDKELVQRMISSNAAVNSHALRMRRLNEEQWRRIDSAANELSVENVWIDDSPSLTLADLFTKSRRMHSRRPLSMIGIDYLQLMECEGENRQQQITTLSRGIKAIARELNVPVVCLSQLNRASATEMRMPRSSDLRESGSIEQDADVVMLLHREAVLHRGDDAWLNNPENADRINEALLIVAKQRNGPCDNIKLNFHAPQTRFTDYRPPGI